MKGVDRRGTMELRFTFGWPWQGAAVTFSGERRPGLVSFLPSVNTYGAGVRGYLTTLFQSVVTHYGTFRCAAKYQWALPRALRRLSASLRAVGSNYPAHHAAVSFSLARGVRRGAGRIDGGTHTERMRAFIHQSIHQSYPILSAALEPPLAGRENGRTRTKTAQQNLLITCLSKRPVSLATSELTRRFVFDDYYHPLQNTSSAMLFLSSTIVISS